MPNAQGTVQDVLQKIDLDIQWLRAERDRIENEIKRAEEAKRYIVSMAEGRGTVGGQVQLAQIPRPVPETSKSQRKSTGTSQHQQVINLAIEILKDRNNKPIRRNELWIEMQARGFHLRNSNPTHYIASRVLGSANKIFGNDNGYFLLDYPYQAADKDDDVE